MMFDNLKNMASMAGMLKDMPRIKAQIEEIKEELGRMHVTGESGGGAVRVIANGHLKIESVEVDQALLSGLVDSTDPDDLAMAQDLIAGATNNALEKARVMAAQKFAEAAGDMGLPIPHETIRGFGDLGGTIDPSI